MFGAVGGLGIGLAVHLRDHFTRQANNISNSFNRMYGTMQNGQNRLSSSLRTMRSTTNGVLALGAGVALGLRDVIKVGSEFEHIMATVGAISGASAADLEKLRKTSLKLGKDFPYTPIEIANSMRELAKAGLNPGQIQDMQKQVLRLGTIAETRIDGQRGAAEMLVNMMAAFGIKAGQAERVVNSLALVSNKTTVDVTDLAETLKMTQTSAKLLGLDLETTLAMAGMLGQSGQKGTFAGTSINNFLGHMSKLVGPLRTKTQDKGLSMLGLDPRQLLTQAGELKPVIDILTLLGDKLRGLSSPQKQNAMFALFGERGKRAQPLLDMLESTTLGPEKGFRGLLGDLNSGKASKVADDILAKKMQTFQTQSKLLRDELQELKISVFNNLVPILLPVVKALRGAVDILGKISETKIGGFLIKTLAVGGGLAMIGAGIMNAFARIGLFILGNSGGAMIGGGMGGMFGSFKAFFARMIPLFARFIPMFTQVLGFVGTFARVLLSPITLIGGLAIALFGLKNTIRMVIDALAYPIRLILSWAAWLASGFSMKAANDVWNKTSLTNSKMGGYEMTDEQKETMRYNNAVRAYQDGQYGRNRDSSNKDLANQLGVQPRSQTIQINMDGRRAMQQTLSKEEENAAFQRLNVNLH